MTNTNELTARLKAQVQRRKAVGMLMTAVDCDELMALTEALEAAEKRIAELEAAQQPAPVALPVQVPDELSIFEAAIDECRASDEIDEHAWNHGVLVVMAKFEACRAAMLKQREE